MAVKFRYLTKALFYAAAAVYPALIFYFLVIRKTPIRMLSLFVTAFALIAFIAATAKKKAKEGLSPCFGPRCSFWASAACAS